MTMFKYGKKFSSESSLVKKSYDFTTKYGHWILAIAFAIVLMMLK